MGSPVEEETVEGAVPQGLDSRLSLNAQMFSGIPKPNWVGSISLQIHQGD
ncbi:MAG: hypothetical protein ACUVRV_03315 [Cyanobacteriota bacterium]